MPTYDYSCDCGHTFEMFRYYSQKDEDVRCPSCGEIGAVTREVSVPMPFTGGPAGSNRSADKGVGARREPS